MSQVHRGWCPDTRIGQLPLRPGPWGERPPLSAQQETWSLGLLALPDQCGNCTVGPGLLTPSECDEPAGERGPVPSRVGCGCSFPETGPGSADQPSLADRVWVGKPKTEDRSGACAWEEGASLELSSLGKLVPARMHSITDGHTETRKAEKHVQGSTPRKPKRRHQQTLFLFQPNALCAVP
jgi:hypothetical protein